MSSLRSLHLTPRVLASQGHAEGRGASCPLLCHCTRLSPSPLGRRSLTSAPRIVNISVLPSPAHAFRALCTAEGEPPPALAWSGPALGNHSAAVLGQSHGYRVTAELSALTHDGRYTCTATNSLGHAEASVYLFRFRGATRASAIALLLGALGLKALLLLGVLAALATRSRLEHQVTQDTPPR
ncbi:Hypothetical predicted protein, partial [Marmota monax]